MTAVVGNAALIRSETRNQNDVSEARLNKLADIFHSLAFQRILIMSENKQRKYYVFYGNSKRNFITFQSANSRVFFSSL